MLLAPAAHARAAPLTVAAYYYPWYGAAGLHWDEGYARAELAAPQRPALGEYDSRDPAVIASQYAWAQRYGVDVFLCSWGGPHGYDDLTLRGRLLPSPARGPTRVAVLYESLQRLGIGADARIHLTPADSSTVVDDFAYLARTSFRDPGYYRIDGRPVAVVYASRIYRGDVAGLIRAVRSAVEAVDGVDPYLIGDEVDWDSRPDPARIRLFDAITGYTLYSRTQPQGWPARTGFLARVGAHELSFRRAAVAAGVAFVPDAMPGFNDRGYRPADDHHVLPPELAPGSGEGSLFSASLELAGGLVDPALGLLAVTSWNEWHEDTQIEPTAPGTPSSAPEPVTQGYAYAPYGFTLLERLALFRRRWIAAPPPLPSWGRVLPR